MITEKSITFEVRSGDSAIDVIVESETGKMTVTPQNKRGEFVFKGSEFETVRMIGSLLKEASEHVERYIIKKAKDAGRG